MNHFSKANLYYTKQEKLEELLLKAQSITALMFTANQHRDEISQHHWHGALWILDDCLTHLVKQLL